MNLQSLSKNENMVFEKKGKTKRTKNKLKKKWRETKPGPPTWKVFGRYLLRQDN